MQGLYTTHEAARILRVHPYTVAKWIDFGELKAWRTAGGHRRVQAADLRAYLVEHELPVPRELGGAGARLRLLVVDADGRLRAIKRGFGPLECEAVLTPTGSGVDAVLLIAETKPDAVLLDLNLEDVDAFDVFRQVRRAPALDGVALVAITVDHSAVAVAQALKAGAASILRLLQSARSTGPTKAASPPRRRRRKKQPRAAVQRRVGVEPPSAVEPPAAPPVAREQAEIALERQVEPAPEAVVAPPNEGVPS